MQNFKNLETPVLITMVNAYSACYGRELTEEESANCKTTITVLQSEIESRKEAGAALVVAKIIKLLFIT